MNNIVTLQAADGSKKIYRQCLATVNTRCDNGDPHTVTILNEDEIIDVTRDKHFITMLIPEENFNSC